jgi:hypothetical protein
MRIMGRTGVRVLFREGCTRDFPATKFEVLASGALQLSGPGQLTFATGSWISASFILGERDDSDAGGAA